MDLFAFLPVSRRADKHDSQNIIAQFKWKKVLSYSGSQSSEIITNSLAHRNKKQGGWVAYFQ